MWCKYICKFCNDVQRGAMIILGKNDIIHPYIILIDLYIYIYIYIYLYEYVYVYIIHPNIEWIKSRQVFKKS